MALEICVSSALTGQTIGAVLELQVDAFAQKPPQHQRELAHHVAQAQHFRLQRLLAREGEKLAHQRRRAQRVLMDLVDFLERRIARLMAHQKEFAIADDDGEQIVEIVRHAAGELAHRLHLLRLREFRLQRFLLGDVDQIKNGALGIAARKRVGIKLRHAVGAAGGTEFDGVGIGAASGHARHQIGDAGAIRRLRRDRECCAPSGDAPGSKKLTNSALASESRPSASANAMPTGASRKTLTDAAGVMARLPAAPNSTRGANHQAERPPESGRTAAAISAPGADGEGFFAGFAGGGHAREAIERGGGAVAAQCQFRRRRRFALRRARHLPIGVVAIEDGAVRSGHRPGDIGARGRFGDALGFFRRERGPRPHGIEQEQRHEADAHQQHETDGARNLRRADRKTRRQQRQEEETQRRPAPDAGRQAVTASGKTG